MNNLILNQIKLFLLSAGFILCCSGNLISQALDTPVVSCITVNALGFATINWQQPSDPNAQFTAYKIYRTIDGVNFNQIASIPDYNITSYTDVTADANNGPACYHVRVESFDGNVQLSQPSQTICSLFIEVLQSNPLGLAELAWNDPLNNLDPNWTFQIYLEYPVGVWSIIASVPVSAQNVYEHEVSTCGDWLNFRIEINAGQPCSFVSNIDGDIFTDSTAPPIPTIQSASVDSVSGNAVLSWEQSSAGDTDGYIVYQCISGFTLIVDTVWGANIVQYENLASTADVAGPEFYALAAFDTCYTGTPPSPNTSPTNAVCHSTIFLTASWFQCQEHVNLQWTPYAGWPDGVSFYEIYVRENGNMETLIGNVSSSMTQFVHNGVTPGNTYQYFIKAYSNGSTFDAISNEITVNVLSTQAPDYLYLSTASVVDPSEVELRLFMQSVPGNIQFQLQRQDRFNGEWNDITTQTAANVNFLSFNDYTPDTDWQSYQYRVLAMDNCGDSIAVSNVAKTIFVTGVGNSQTFVNTLSWNPYIEWDGGVQEYRIYRSIENLETLNLIGTASASNLYYEDDVNSLLLTSGEFCYVIEAVENPNFLGISETSKSNELCILQDPKIWVPNSIIINGFNNEFKPVISFADFDNYQLIVYNRWGDEIFKSNDINQGWDGTVNGNQVQEGIYLYYISIVDGYGSFHERRGPIYTLIGGKE